MYKVELGHELKESIESIKIDEMESSLIGVGKVYIGDETGVLIGSFIVKIRFSANEIEVRKYMEGAACLEDEIWFNYPKYKLEDSVLLTNVLKTMIEANFLM